MRYPFIAGNWKMYKTVAEAKAFATEFKKLYHDTGIGVGAQNVHFEKEGAFTGEVSVPMLEEIGVDYCIVGHSERRQYFGETDESINRKLKALLETKIVPILCVGEDLQQREAKKAVTVVSSQIKEDFKEIRREDAAKIVVAYEPIWAIGTGKTATPEQAGEMCSLIRETLIELYDEETADQIIIQYGGSVKPENASQILNMDEIDGALVGGASLDPLKFIEIVNF